MEQINRIYLERYKKLFVKSSKKKVDNTEYVKAIMGEIAGLGFTLSGDLINELKSLSINELEIYNELLIETLMPMVGADVNHIPLFRNFPDDVPDDFQYLRERIFGFLENIFNITDGYKVLSCGHAINTEVFDLSNFGACPICQMRVDMDDLDESQDRPPLEEITPFKIIDLGTKKEADNILKNLLSSTTSISQQDREDIETFFEVYGKRVKKLLPEEIPFKENRSLVVNLSLKYLAQSDFIVLFVLLKKYMDTATDLLRVITALSGGDESLTQNTEYRKFSRKYRRLFLSVLDSNGKLEDMLRYRKRWIRIGEILHPGDYKNQYPIAFELFQKLRSNYKYETFRSKVEKNLTEENWENALSLLKTRPGEFIRKLDFLLRLSNESPKVIKTIKEVADRIPTPTLLQVKEHIKNRTDHQELRIFFPKGQVSKAQVIEDDRKLLSKETCDEVSRTIEISLKNRFSKLDKLGKVYIHPELKGFKVPFSQRTASKSLESITRGSIVELPNSRFIRAFLHWMQDKGDVRHDLDLTVAFYNKDWESKGWISYTILSNEFAKHSGDLQSAPPPHGASEFVDIDMEKARKSGVKYVIMSVYDYTDKGFTSIPESFAGIMARQDSRSGEVFEPRTVRQRFDITGDTPSSIPMILDLEENKMIWADLALSGSYNLNNIESSSGSLLLLVKSTINLIRPNLYDLFRIHAQARGELVKNKKDADFTFDLEDADVRPSEIDKIMEFLK